MLRGPYNTSRCDVYEHHPVLVSFEGTPHFPNLASYEIGPYPFAMLNRAIFREPCFLSFYGFQWAVDRMDDRLDQRGTGETQNPDDRKAEIARKELEEDDAISGEDEDAD